MAEELAKKLFEITREINLNYLDHNGVNPRKIPNKIRLEIIKTYEEHRGLGLLQEILKIPANTILNWYKRYRRFPQCFTEEYHGRTNNRKSVVHHAITKSGGTVAARKKYKKYHSIEVKSNDPTSLESVRASLPNDVLLECHELRNQITVDTNSKVTIDNAVKKQILKLVLKAGTPKPIALILGLNEKTIMSWKSVLKEDNESHILLTT